MRFCCFGGAGILVCMLVVALGISDGQELEKTAIWLVIVAGCACLARSLIHVIWGKYLTWRPSQFPDKRRELVELNVLVPLNVLLSGIWIWHGFANLGQDSLYTPPLPSLALFVGVTLVAMETVRCVRWTGKQRGTEIVCEGPVGAWFRDFFETSDEGTGFVHKIMVFFRNPNGSKTVSRFLMVLAAVLMVPSSIHASTATGHRIHRIIFGPTAPGLADGDNSTRKDEEQGDPDEGGQSESESESDVEDEEDSWERQCGDVYDGRPAPSPNREQLAGLFKAEGSKAAGCPRPAQQVLGQEGVWYARSYCGAELRSVGLTAPDYLPAILYQQAAKFAEARAEEGVLLGASSRWPHKGGDLYVVNTTSGSFVLARRRSSADDTSTDEGGSHLGNLPCQSYVGGNVPYTVVPPGLVALWLEVAETEWVWPRSVGATTAGRSFEFVPPYPSRETVATATCVSDVQCTLSFQGEERATPWSRYTSVTEIASAAQ